MTLHPTPVSPVAEQTIRIARAAVPKGNIYVQMRDVLGSIYADEQFADLFADLFASRGRPVLPPWRLAAGGWRLALVTVMQVAEGLFGPTSRRSGARAQRLEIGAGAGSE
jgi:transposase